MYNLILKPEAENDLQQAFLFYEGKRVGLGYDFINSVEATVNCIERNPFGFQTKHKNIRRAFTYRFPFGVFFLVDGHNIYVLAFVHTRMNEHVWKSRNI